MKCEVIITEKGEEKVLIYTKEETPLVREIISLTEENSMEISGYIDREIVKLNPSEIYCFTVENNKVFALCKKKKYSLRQRLYTLEEMLPENFIKINQSTIANLRLIDRFDASVSGTLKVYFKNGHVDFVSRRQLKTLKEKVGI